MVDLKQPGVNVLPLPQKRLFEAAIHRIYQLHLRAGVATSEICDAQARSRQIGPVTKLFRLVQTFYA
jgi:hypothetical protein